LEEKETNSDQNESFVSEDDIDQIEKQEIKEISQIQDRTDNLKDNSSDVAEKSKTKVISKNDTLFKRVLENGFDGITTNPNYKLLALLIILLINLSLFFLVGNLGKNFLRNSGILG
tara:strand:+ start:703 stop:1050 length:348 start_codon:yes stop_codon:yes gene_type:complete